MALHGRVLRRLRHALNVRLVDVAERGAGNAVEGLREDLAREREARQALHAEVTALREELHAVEIRDRRDMFAAGERDAVTSSARFVNRTMPGARTFPSPAATLAHALDIAPAGGLALEFGVYSGTTLRAIAAARRGGVHGFDSFAGLPEHWRAGFPAGQFAVAALPEVDGAELVVGWFADTLPGFLDEHPGPVDLLHLDADLYSSTVTVLEHVGPRLRTGSVVVFDEYLNHPGWEDGEHRAWSEYAERTDTTFSYEAFTHDNEQVVVVIR